MDHHLQHAGDGALEQTKLHTSDPVLAEIVRRLVDAYQPERIYLFGSRARGEAGVDSDYDVLVVVRDDAPSALRRSRRAYEALRGTGVAADVVVLTLTSFERRLPLISSLPATVVDEGELLYAA
jgi:predicted nucleotidyltransferase